MEAAEKHEQGIGQGGIMRDLADLPPDTAITEEGLSRILHKHRKSIKRAAQRQELPVPVRLFGEPTWTVQALRDHMNKRLEAAQKSADRAQKRISDLAP